MDGPWDAWSHYHLLTGALLWHEAVGSTAALAVAVGIGGVLARRIPRVGSLNAMGNYHVNCSVLDGLAWLARATGDPGGDLAAVCKIVLSSWQLKGNGDWLRNSQAGLEYYQSAMPRWECIHSVNGLAELYWTTGDRALAVALQQIWWSLCKLERKPQGGLMSQEQAVSAQTSKRQTCAAG